jgi:dTDP-4-amino-4,6-dideoxygalactose transaminase
MTQKENITIIKNEIDTAINNVLNHGLFINGPEVKKLERRIM